MSEYFAEMRNEVCRFLDRFIKEEGILLDDILHYQENQDMVCFFQNNLILKS